MTTYLIGPHATHEQHQGTTAVCGIQGGVLTRERPARLCKRCAARRAAWERAGERIKRKAQP